MNKNLPIPKNEVSRLDALAQYNILDTLPEEEFDRLTQLASIICGVPIAVITLIDKDRQWFKSKIGLDAPETPRDISFCQYAINGESLLEIEDATKDERFLSSPLVTDQPNIRFYAGYPLIDPDGYALGALCVIDRKTRKLTAAQGRALTLLANEVVSQIVSRKKNAEKDKLEKLFNLSIDMICVMGTDGYLKKINPAFTITLGWTIEELLAKPFINFLHPDDITRTINQIEKLKRGEKSIDFQNRYITINGDYLTISWTAIPDEITGERYVVGRNVSDRIKGEQALLLSEEKHRSFFENTANFACIANVQGYFEVINPNFEKILGYTERELLESQFLSFIHPDDIDLTLKEIEKLQSGANTINFENRYRKKDGNYLRFDWNITSNPVIGKLYAVGRDITERKKTEEELRMAHLRLLQHLNNSPLAVIEWDKNSFILDWSPQAENMFGWSKAEVLNKYFNEFNFVLEEDAPTVGIITQELMPGAVTQNKSSNRNKTKSGNIIHCEWFNSVLKDDEGNVNSILSLVLDVTERKKLELELVEAKNNAEASTRAKESFLANMSHEIRTPLNAIIGFLRELEKQELSDLQKIYIDNSSIASKHLLDILNNILDISKIEAGEMSLEAEDFLIEDIVNNVLKVLNLKAKQKEIRLTSLISDKVNKVFKGDSLRLEQILFNLIGNALKFTQKGKIEVSCEVLSDSNTSQIIRISVADTGMGMEQKYAESIFEKFSQEDKSITRKYGGTGLGMAITKELVNLMGGEIEIESKKNKGTTIHVKINLIKGNVESVKKLHAEVNFNLKGLSILLVEDNEVNRMVVQNTLQYFNCNVTEVENGFEALEILKTQNFDLILMDIQMPEMDGIEATKVIRKELKLSTPIIALTANAFKTEIEKCKRAGMNDYVTKPFEEAVLLQTIVKHTIYKNGIPSLYNEVNPNQPLYNLNVLHNLSRGSDEFVLKMVGVFVEQTIATIEKIDAALESNNFSEISRLIHKIKPSINSMGVLSIQSEMKILEKITNETQNKGQITAIYNLVKKTLQLVISQLHKNELNV